MGKLIYFSLAVFFFTIPDSVRAQIPSFPGAEGFGAVTKGGRGGQVFEVTNLNDSGTGSLRECVQTNGARTCVFKVAGTITLNSNIEVASPFLTIAGQTAPGGGITLKAANPNTDVHLKIRASDVIIRYMRFRPGTTITNSRALSINNGATTMASGVKNVMIDHNSFSWAGDELTIFWLATNNVTYQWNIAAETLSPWKGPSFGEDGGGYYSVHHNLIAHNSQRSPQVSANSGPIDIVNNLIYNPGGLGSVVKNNASVNYVKNYIKAGPNSTLSHYVDDGGNDVKGPAKAVYVEGNQLDGIQNITNSTHLVQTRLTSPVISETSPLNAYNQILETAGAYRGLNCDGTWFSRRDSVDSRIVQSVKDKTRGHNGTGYITSPSQVGGWPSLAAGTPCPDSDHDGMPDAFETKTGLNPQSATDGNQDKDSDGYTNLEEYLNGDSSGTGPTTPGGNKPGDANSDGKIDGLDYVIWLNNYNKQATGASSGDFDNSGNVDGLDYVLWLNSYGK